MLENIIRNCAKHSVIDNKLEITIDVKEAEDKKGKRWKNSYYKMTIMDNTQNPELETLNKL